MNHHPLPMPVRIVSNITLDTTVAEVLELLPPEGTPFEDYNSCELDYHFLPNTFRRIRLGDIVYLDEPVSALTSRAYLNGLNSSYTIAHLFTLKKGTFFPVRPDVIKI